MPSELGIENLEREAIYNILTVIRQRWQDQALPVDVADAPAVSLLASSCEVATDVSVDVIEDDMAATMILQRPEFVASVVAVPVSEDFADEMDKTVIIAPSAPSAVVAPVVDTPVAVDSSAAILDSIRVANSNIQVELESPINVPTPAADLADDPLAKTQILSRFGGGNSELPAAIVPESKPVEDDNFAATVILNPAARKFPQSPQSPNLAASTTAVDADDLAKTCILQPFAGAINNQPVVEDNSVAPLITITEPPDSLLATVIMPPPMGRPKR